MPPKKPEPVVAAPVKKVRPTRSFAVPSPSISEWKQATALSMTPSSSLVPFVETAAAALQGGASSDAFEDKQPIPLPPALTSMTVHWCRPHELGTLDGSVPKVVETVRSTAGADDAGNISSNGVAFIAKACKAHVSPLDAFNASVMAALHALNNYSIQKQLPPLWRSIYPQDSDGNPVIAASGKYFVKVWCGSSWFLMEVDDRIPCDAEKIPLLPRSSDELEIWPHLLVKAALKTGAFGDGSGSSSSSELFALLVSVLGGWSVVKHSGDLGIRHVLFSAAATLRSSSLPFVPVLVGAHPNCDALQRYSLYSHSVFVVDEIVSNEQEQVIVTAHGAQMKWERPQVPAKVDVDGRPLTDDEVQQELLSFPKPPEYPDKRRTRQLLLLRDAPCSGKQTWTHAEVFSRSTSALMCFPPASLKHAAEWREATVDDLKPAVGAGGRPNLGPHEARSLVVSNATDCPARVIIEVSSQAAPLHVTVALNAWATSALAYTDAKAAAAASEAAAAEAAQSASNDVAETETPVDTEHQSTIVQHSSSGDASSKPASVQVVPAPYSGSAAFTGTSSFCCSGMLCFEIISPPGRAVYSISCSCPDMALALGFPGVQTQNLSFGGFCICIRSDSALQFTTESEAYSSLGFTVRETFAQVASLDEWVDDHIAVASLKCGALQHAVLQQLLLPSTYFAPYISSTRFIMTPPSSTSSTVVGCAPALIRSSPSDDAVVDQSIIVHISSPFELKPDVPPMPAILRLVAAPGDSIEFEGSAPGVWSEHTGTYVENFRMLLKRLVLEAASVTDVRVYLRCYSPATCCLAASDSPDGDRCWQVEGAGAGSLHVQSPLFALQPGAPTILTAYLKDVPVGGEQAVPIAWVMRIWSRTEVQVRENTEPEDAISKLISSFEEGNSGRSKEAEAARAASVAQASEPSNPEAAVAALAEALAQVDRKTRYEAVKKAASLMPSPIEILNANRRSTLAVDAAQITAMQEAKAIAVAENEAAAKAVADNRENLKPRLAKWAFDLDGRASKSSSSDIDKVFTSSIAQRNAFRQAAAVYASHVMAVEQALAQVKLGRNPPAEEGGEETVSLANLELVQEVALAAQEGGDWPAATAKVIEAFSNTCVIRVVDLSHVSQLKALGVWPKPPESAPVDPKKKVSADEQARAEKEFADAKLLYDAAAAAPPVAILRSHVGAKLDHVISAAVARLQGEIQEVQAAIKEDTLRRAEAAAAAAAAPAKKK